MARLLNSLFLGICWLQLLALISHATKSLETIYAFGIIAEFDFNYTSFACSGVH